MLVESGTGARNDRPCACVGGGSAGEVSGIEFFEGGVDVVEVEHDASRDPLVAVDFEDPEDVGSECLGPLVVS